MTKPKKGKHMLRMGRYSIKGHYYFITICTNLRQKILDDLKIVQIIFNSLDYLQETGRINLICCIVMPDHLHLVFQLLGDGELSKVISSFKRHTARQINKLIGREGHLWQEQYYEHRIRAEEDLWEIARYCHENPVRRGMVDHPDKYPFWEFHPENIDR